MDVFVVKKLLLFWPQKIPYGVSNNPVWFQMIPYEVSNNPVWFQIIPYGVSNNPVWFQNIPYGVSNYPVSKGVIFIIQKCLKLGPSMGFGSSKYVYQTVLAMNCHMKDTLEKGRMPL